MKSKYFDPFLSAIIVWIINVPIAVFLYFGSILASDNSKNHSSALLMGYCAISAPFLNCAIRFIIQTKLNRGERISFGLKIAYFAPYLLYFMILFSF